MTTSEALAVGMFVGRLSVWMVRGVELGRMTRGDVRSRCVLRVLDGPAALLMWCLALYAVIQVAR